jgi:ribosomal-protein-alanine N-acetyltransferase
VGVLGYWLIAGEAHIIIVAVNPRWQRRGLGEWLLLNFFDDAQTRAAEVATLEVRPSNHKAIVLYQKYGFALVGRRPKYYLDTGEDALILTTPPLASAAMQTLLTKNRHNLLPRLKRSRIDKSGQLD